MPLATRTRTYLCAALLLLGCRSSTTRPPAESSPPAATTPSPAVESPPQSTLTAEQVRTLVYENHRILAAESSRAFRTFDYENNVVGRCHGSEAVAIAREEDVLPSLKERVGGKALPCFVRAYFGCIINGQLAAVSSDTFGPNLVPYVDSKVALVETTPRRVVADVEELIADAESNGKPSLQHIGVNENPYRTSRYVLERGDDERWRITDRVPPKDDAWQCQE